jgi:dTDP-4-amino-4,6-dideoxygalactose transaminase
VTTPFLPYGRQDIAEDDLAAVAKALQSDYLTTGPLVGEFEAAFAKSVGARHAVISNSGTAALHLACIALDLGPGDSVIVPAITFLATANAARFCGAEVIFADVDPDSGRLTAETFEAALANNPNAAVRAVLPVHLNGHCVDMPAIRAIAEPRGIAVIEDACHAVGGRHQAGNNSLSLVGSCALSELACFSLHPVKTITSGEGGVTTTNDPAAYRRMLSFRSHGMVVLHLYAVLIDFAKIGRSRAEVMKDLKAAGIGTMVHYIPVNRQPYYRQRYGETRLPGADAYYERVLSIPLYPTMQDEDVDRVVAALQALTR